MEFGVVKSILAIQRD